MKRNYLLLSLLLMFSLTLVACGNKKETSQEAANTSNTKTTETTTEAKDLTVGFVSDEGGVNDRSFNEGVFKGITKAEEELGIKKTYKESTQASEYDSNLETVLDEGAQLIVGAGFKMGDAIVKAAKENPDVNYVIVDVDVTSGVDEKGNPIKVEAPSNLLGIMFRAKEPSFLVGYIAGYTTQSNLVGFVGGQESTLIKEFEYGYTAGVKYAAKELGKEIDVKAQYVGNFSDAQKGKAIANQMYSEGADVVFHASGGAGDGVISAAEEQHKWAIGVDMDQYEVSPEHVLTSAMKNANVVVFDVIKDLAEGKPFEGGKTVEYGLKEDGSVGIAPTSDKNVPQEILDKTAEVEKKIVADEIVVPGTEAEYTDFVNNLK